MLTFAVLAILSGCGGDEEDDYRSGITTCGDFTACGGDIVGTWRMQDYCSDDLARALGMNTVDACQGAVLSLDFVVEGTYTFDGADTRSYAWAADMSMHTRYSPACLRELLGDGAQDVAAACGAIDDRFRSSPTFTSGSCVLDASHCDCMVSAQVESMGSESYRVSGTTLLDPDDPPSDYCVQGDTLTMVEHDEADVLITFTRQL
jgi:hypothetical protein